MIPAIAVPQLPQTACAPDGACWIAGTGFRAVIDTAQACAIDDAPLAGKLPPGSMMTRLSTDPLAGLPGAMPAEVLATAPGTVFAAAPLLPPLPDGGACCIIQEPSEPLPQPAPVPIEAEAGMLLIAALAALAALRRRRR